MYFLLIFLILLVLLFATAAAVHQNNEQYERKDATNNGHPQQCLVVLKIIVDRLFVALLVKESLSCERACVRTKYRRFKIGASADHIFCSLLTITLLELTEVNVYISFSIVDKNARIANRLVELDSV